MKFKFIQKKVRIVGNGMVLEVEASSKEEALQKLKAEKWENDDICCFDLGTDIKRECIRYEEVCEGEEIDETPFYLADLDGVDIITLNKDGLKYLFSRPSC